jgi:hypothetical protein
MGLIVPERFLKWQKIEINAEQTKSTAPYSTLIELVAKDVVPGTYKLHWYVEVKLDSLPSPSRILLRMKAKTNIVATHEVATPMDEYQSWAGWDFIQLGNRENPAMTMEWRRPNGNADLLAQHARLSIEFMEGEPGPGRFGLGGENQGQTAAVARSGGQS